MVARVDVAESLATGTRNVKATRHNVHRVPFTPFHLGPGLLVALPLRRHLDLPTVLVASVAVDARTALVFFGLLDGPLHGPVHTYVGALVLAGVLAAATVLGARRFPGLARSVSATPGDPRAAAMGGLAGTWLHVTLDAFLYTDMTPLWPLAGNPLLGLVGGPAVYDACVVAGLAGVAFLAVLGLRDRRVTG